MVSNTPMVNTWPMLAVPGWVEKPRLPKLAMVVNALSSTALGVLVCISLLRSVLPVLARLTICMPLSTPMPKSRGRAIILAKLNGILNITLAQAVNTPANRSGAMTMNV